MVYLYSGWQVLEERVRETDNDPWVLAGQFIYGGLYIGHAAEKLRQASEAVIFDKDTTSNGVLDTRYYYAQQAW